MTTEAVAITADELACGRVERQTFGGDGAPEYSVQLWREHTVYQVRTTRRGIGNPGARNWLSFRTLADARKFQRSERAAIRTGVWAGTEVSVNGQWLPVSSYTWAAPYA